MRPSGRKFNELRDIKIEKNINKHAEGSCLIKVGNTEVICLASIEENVPPFLRKSGVGWITAEYSMLPRSTGVRMRRESSIGKQSGRTLEIQRLIGRSLRGSVDRVILGERQITIDCDVIQADGGTRCAAITGGWVAMKLAIEKLLKNKKINEDPVHCNVAAISCGSYEKNSIIDLDYVEDSNAEIDANFIMNEKLDFLEIQSSAEGSLFTKKQLNEFLNLAEEKIPILIDLQNEALKS